MLRHLPGEGRQAPKALDKLCAALIGCPAQRRRQVTPLLLDLAVMLRDAKEWNEADHTRKKNGEFGKGAGGGESKGHSPEADKLLGQEHAGVKGKEAIEKLLEEKNGHVKGAFHREGIGDIDLLWGNDGVGLKHIIKRREKQGIDVKKFLSDLPDVIAQGRIRKGDKGRLEIIYKGKKAIVSPELYGNKLTFLLTAYKIGKK